MFDLKISYYNLNQLLMPYLEFNKVELSTTKEIIGSSTRQDSDQAP
jgi:hypothetical protein